MDPVVLTVIGTGIALFAANWRVQAGWFAMMDKRFQAVDKQFEGAERLNRERFEMAESQSRERFEMAESQSRERFDAVNRQFEAADKRWTERFEASERRNEAAHTALCESLRRLEVRLDKSEERARADNLALRQHFDTRFDAVNERFDAVNERFDAVNERFDAVNERFDGLYRHLLGAGPGQDAPGAA